MTCHSSSLVFPVHLHRHGIAEIRLDALPRSTRRHPCDVCSHAVCRPALAADCGLREAATERPDAFPPTIAPQSVSAKWPATLPLAVATVARSPSANHPSDLLVADFSFVEGGGGRWLGTHNSKRKCKCTGVRQRMGGAAAVAAVAVQPDQFTAAFLPPEGQRR